MGVDQPLFDLGDRVLVLASASPRRRDLLALLGQPFTVIAADVDETPHPSESATELVSRLAVSKAAAVAAWLDPALRHRSVVIAADTVVVVDDDILGKPGDDATAAAMLRRLSGRRHTVATGMALVVDGEPTIAWTTTVLAEVSFALLDDDVIAAYVTSGEPHDKAGAYAIQGIGGAFVDAVHGSPSAVVGLALAELLAALRAVR